ncbi:hypothetical protein QEH52_01625 [Coraliomargarita sp. SDUM461003]|uniref:Uncharacterized protein n=1 Tax=Thalassobacterium maritimum TaxID=3041265 RepID=A0ABU1APW1_9BACT|nr:hypothetical protein [Coraliomargarita sp. SDUM461003]MDQ8206191.1 hypothetical protein [Coraliomargarita sp. SDUM461003]
MKSGQLKFEAELLSHLDRFEARLRDLRDWGKLLWVKMLRAVVRDLIGERQKRDDAIYKQLMLLESMAQRDASPEIVVKIQSLKGMLAVLCMALCLWSICELSGPVRVWRVRGRSREEMLVEGLA